MKKAFLSHNSVDKEFVLEVARELGYSQSIIDSFNFQEGEDFRNLIKDNLKQSDLFVLFASKESLKASWVKYEVNLAELSILNGDLNNIIVFLINGATHNDLPSWLRNSLAKSIDNPKIAAVNVEAILNTKKNFPLYIGRGETQNKFDSDYFKSNNDIRNLVFHGLPGIGRRTFARKSINHTFSLSISKEYSIEEIDPLASLYRDLLIDFNVINTIEEFTKYKIIFSKLDLKEQVCEIINYLNRFSDHKQVPILIDNDGMLDSKGAFTESIVELFRQIDKTDNLFVAYVLERNPKDFINKNLYFSIYIPELNKEFTEHLLKQYCSLYYGIQISKQDAEEIGAFLNGYPPTIEIASYEIQSMGIDIVKKDTSFLTRFTRQSFEEYLDKHITNDKQKLLLKILGSFNNELSLPILDTLVPDNINILIELMNLNIVKINHVSNLYSISLPLLDSVWEKYGVLSRVEYTKATIKLKDRFWETENLVNNNNLSTIIYSLLRSSETDGLKDFKNWIVPSDIYKTAKAAYLNRDWKNAINLFTQLLSLNKTNVNAWEYLARAKIHIGENTHKEMGKLRKLDKDKYELVLAFKLVKNNEFKDAIVLLEKIKEKEYFPPYVYRELGECYYQTGNYDKVQKNINDGFKSSKDKSNKYMLDLAAKYAIKIEDYNLAEEYIELLEQVNDVGSVSHRKATLFFKQGLSDKALEHSINAVNSTKPRLEFYLLLANIYICMDKNVEANKTLSDVEKKFKNVNIKNHTIFNRLKCIYFIRIQDRNKAEEYFNMLPNGHGSYLEAELLNLELKEKGTNLIRKEEIKSKLQSLGTTNEKSLQFIDI